MRFNISIVLLILLSPPAMGQTLSKSDSIRTANKRWIIKTNTEWYSETTTDGITIQNSFPKGGRYPGPTKKNFNHSYLVFFTRVINETATPIELNANFSADSISIPGSPDTFVKLFLPADTMTFAKQILYSYGITGLASFDKPTRLQRTIESNGECLFYVVGFFYQTKPDAANQERGGNRAELVLEGKDLFYRMPPQIESLPCGQIVSKE